MYEKSRPYSLLIPGEEMGSFELNIRVIKDSIITIREVVLTRYVVKLCTKSYWPQRLEEVERMIWDLK